MNAFVKSNLLTVISRSGETRPFDATRIERAVLGAINEIYPAVDRGQENRNIATEITGAVLGVIAGRQEKVVSVEEIQDLVERNLMATGLYDVAKAFILYRANKAKNRESPQALKSKHVVLVDGSNLAFDQSALARDLEAVLIQHGVQQSSETAAEVASQVYRDIYDGVSIKDFDIAVINAVRTRIEMEPAFTYVAAHLMLKSVYQEVAETLGVDNVSSSDVFKLYLERGIKEGAIDEELAKFDLDLISNAIKPERDSQFNFLGIQTLYDRYLLKTKRELRFELPQYLFMRVAMGLAVREVGSCESRAVEFYEVLSSFDYMTSTPTLFNAGTLRPQLSSCYLTTIPDSLDGIYDGMKQNALLSKYAGGLGNDWTPVRSLGAYINGTNGRSQGVIPFLKVANDTAIAVNQGGKRKGAVCAYLETWHADIEDFLDLRKNTGDDRRRTHDMNTANWIPDLFMERVMQDDIWTLFSPDEVPELHDLYGVAFRDKYEEYELKGQRGELFVYKQVSAKGLWRKMLQMLFETGHPWLTFKDPCNIRNPQQHVGVVHSSNLCTEITLVTNKDEVAVCNLGSVNLVNHIVDGQLDRVKLRKTVQTAMRMLDNVIDINYYSVPESKTANLRHRPVGLGIMGFQDALYKMSIAYASDEAVRFADESMESISYFAFEASASLAEERGSYATFEGSSWSKGYVPIDTAKDVVAARGTFTDSQGSDVYTTIDLTVSGTHDWGALRQRIKKGMRNSNCLAIAPTATISNICGVSQSIEPTYQNLYVKSNLSGEFTILNQYLVERLKALGLWDGKMMNELKYFDGSVQRVEGLPEDVKAIFKTAFEIDPAWLIECASRRQKWIDQAQSLNLYIAGVSGKKLDETYRLAWVKGLKTTYYLRALGATSAEKSTGNGGELNAVSSQDVAPKACSIDNPDCEACQ